MSHVAAAQPVRTARQQQLLADVRAGLTAQAKTLPSKWFYDQRGSELFDQITQLPEYYPTRVERAILRERSAEIATHCPAVEVIELGSGTSDKTRLLLSALQAHGTLETFIPFDVDPSVLTQATQALAADFPALRIAPIVGDFEHDLAGITRTGRRLVAFLGSTIGNFEPGPRAEFLARLAHLLEPGDGLLLGFDLTKDPARLIAAYDDPAGVTAEFNRNILAVINRELGARFDLQSFEHRAVWDPDAEQIQMRLRSRVSQRVALPGFEVSLAAGEEIQTEVSAKFRRPTMTSELAAAGLRPHQWWTDPAEDFALCLAGPA